MLVVIKGVTMESIKFLKTLNVLYVEDDLYIREKVTSIFDQIFNFVVVAANGEEGLDAFKQCSQNDMNIDIIISDINMPKLSGLEMIKEIRKLDKDVPFILTTAYSSSNFLLEAIEYGVAHYAIKPVDIKELIKQVDEVCMANYKLKIMQNKNNELLEYLHIIDQVAIVSRIDLKGNYVFVNDIFCHVSGYNKVDVIGKDKNMIRHKDMPKEVYEELWDTLQDGGKWNGKLKNCGSNNKEYFTKTTILPYYDMETTEISEYVEISFLITVEEHEKREFRKKVMQNIQETKRQNFVARKMIDDLQNKLKRFKHIDILEETIVNEREKTKRFKRQSEFYERQLSVVNIDKELAQSESKSDVQRISEELSKVKYRKNIYFNQVNEYKEELESRVELCDTLNSRIKKQARIIKDLKNTINNKNSQLLSNNIKIA